MLLTKEVDIKIIPKMINYYKEKGYEIPKCFSEKSGKEVYDFNSVFKVKIEDLPESSKIKIQYKCDNCGKIFTTTYHMWIHSKYKELGDLCKNCARQIKFPKAMKDKYGATNPSNVQSIIEKRTKTNLEKYGNEWAIASTEVRKAILHSIQDRYRVDNPMKSEEIKRKAIATNNKKYGGNSSTCSEEIKEKIRKTCLEKYGVPCCLQADEVKKKIRKTLHENGTVPSSKAERKLCDLLKEIYGKNNCIPSYPEGNLSFDCLLKINGNLIDVEYDGIYWHKDRGQIDAARNAVLMNKGYRIIRIKGNNNDDMPTKEQIIQAVDYLVKDNHHLIFIDMNV